MNWDEGTGGGASFERPGTPQIPLVYESVSGDRWVPGIETPGSRSTGEAKRRPMSVPGPKLRPSSRRIPDRAMQKRRLYLKACLDELERVRNGGENPILKGNSLADAKDHLQALWELVEGNPNSEPFEEMINVLQIALCADTPEALTLAELDAIWSVLATMHSEPDFDDETANALTQELIKGGVDVFREIG